MASSSSFRCPNCEGIVPEGAIVCPHCGSDDQTGWSPNTIYDDIGLPEVGEGSRPRVFKDTLLYKDIKWLMCTLLFIAFLTLSLSYF